MGYRFLSVSIVRIDYGRIFHFGRIGRLESHGSRRTRNPILLLRISRRYPEIEN